MSLRGHISMDALRTDADVVRFTATEAIAELFDVDVLLACDTPDLDLDAALWTVAVLSLVDLAAADAEPRWFHGVIEEADYLGARGGRFHYRLRLRPRLHGLAYRARSRIFQEKSAVEVIQRVIRDAGLADAGFRWALGGRYPTRAYCVQYRETELAFVRRLLEDEGVFWTFEHRGDDHVMVFGDGPDAHALVDGDPVIPFVRAEHHGRERVTDLVFTTRPAHDAWHSRDWTPDDPGLPREATHAIEGESRFERAEYPGGYGTNADGLRRATARLAAARVEAEVLSGRTNSRRVLPGRTFTLAGAAQEVLCRDWLVLSVEHRFVDHGLAGDGGAAATYDASFRAVPGDVAFRPKAVTPRPRAWGKDSAVVTGPAAEEICVDERGRVKVHFYWDREGAVDETASCWVRVQQQNTSGAMLLPRVGWEVSVGYLDGDPDRPYVMQKLYNQETMPPYALPAAGTQTALQTATSPGGGSTNELRLQDGAGGMEFFLHASRDLRVTAGHDLAESIDVDAAEEVGVDLSCLVGAAQRVHVGGNDATSVTGAFSAEVAGSRAVSIGGNDDRGVKTNESITADGARTETVGGMMNVLANSVSEIFHANCTRTAPVLSINSAVAIADSAGGSKRELTGAARLEIVRKSYAENVHGVKTLAAGAATIKAGADIQTSAKGALAINVAGPLVESCGGGYSIGARAVVVTTGNLSLKAAGSSLSAAGGALKFKGAGLSVKGSVSVKLKGTIDYK